jgi:F-type H+-transporting ATPase subunit b
MSGNATTIATTEKPANDGGGFPPFDTTTFASQWFWLVITFGFLFVVMWRVAGPRINGVITVRRNTINGDIQAAQKARGDAEAAGAAYEMALAGARKRANAMAEENRQTLNAEIARAKADAEAGAASAMAAADARIASTREAARGHVTRAAEEAAIAIVARLTGDTVPDADAAKAVRES